MPRGVPKAKQPDVYNGEAKAAEEKRLAEKYRRELAAQPDRDVLVTELSEMVQDERRIADNERINIVVEYACLGQDPKPEKYVGRPRYIKGTRHGRTRLAKRSARRDDIPPPEEKMIFYDEEAARILHSTMFANLRLPGADVKPDVPKDEPMDDDEHAKEHSRDSGCPVSPADKGEDKKEASSSSRGSEEKEGRKRRSPDFNNAEEANSHHSGTSHFIVRGNTPLTVIHKLLERKRQVHQDLRLELIDASGKEILTDDYMNRTVAFVANERGWARNRPLRLLYTITRFTESEDIPVLDVQEKCDDAMAQEDSPALEPSTPLSNAPSPQQLQHLQHLQHMQMQQMHMHQQMQQHMQQQQRMQQQQGNPQFQQTPMAIVINDDGSQSLVPYMQHLTQQFQQDQEGLLAMSGQAPPPHHHFMAGHAPQMLTPPPPQQQTTSSSSSIFPQGHVIVEHGNGNSHLVPANMSVESVISSKPSVKKRQRMAPQRAREVDAMMKKHGIPKGRALESTSNNKGPGGSKMGLPTFLGNLPGIVSIRMPQGCTPQMMAEMTGADLPIEATTVDGRSHPTTIKELPALSNAVMKRMQQQAAAAAAAALPSSMLTPEERMQETISTVRSKAAAMHEQIQAEARRASSASSSSSAAAAAAAAEDAAAPVLQAELQLQPTDVEEMTPPPQLDAPETPDSPRSLEIDEREDVSPPSPPPAPQSMKGIPA